MLESNEVDASEWMELYEDALRNDEKNKTSNFEIKGSYWWSKVNWTSFGFSEEDKNPKKQKKFTIGVENKKSKYHMYEKVKDEEYKTNLIYSILKSE